MNDKNLAEQRFQLSNADNCLVYEGNQYWWYTDYDICRDWWPEDGKIDINWLFKFVDRVAAGFEMDEDEALMLLGFILSFRLDDYLNNKTIYSDEFIDFLKKYKLCIIPD
ncbi:MAG: hypothetical protein SOV80_06715 [Bacilli bacterium]|nr:hypothetical protein [bacterium]MDY2697889.1 hypothetical protein [Bacilli bacterium]